MRKTGVIIFDMDDTLVNREEVYVKAQKILLNTLMKFGAKISLNEAFTTLREIDYNLVSLHGGEFMYNYKELARALWLYYVEGKSVTDACSIAFQEGKRKIRFKPAEEAAKRHNKVLKETIPTLKENTFEILKKLKQKYVLVLLSVGKKNIQGRVVSYYKFDKIFDLILIRSRKSIKAFNEAKKEGIKILTCKYGGVPDHIIVVGDMISQDIALGNMIGAETVWIPGPYNPSNEKEASPNYKISNLCELPSILLPFKLNTPL